MTDPAPALIEALAAELAPRPGAVSPAQAWGVVDGGELVHAAGSGGAAAHPADTAFRIASCTKSFTASAALLLAQDGVLDLDGALADALDVPLGILGPVGPAPTIRDALSMRAGFPTDDPWADRQESLTDDAFGETLSEGVRSVRAAGAHYEYSNLGYAIVGRIIGLRAGQSYREVVEERLLRPLGLDGTGFDAGAVAAAGGVVPGYRHGPGGWIDCPFSGPGAFSPIGGLFSTVRDLATWITALGRSADGRGPLPAEVALALARPSTPIGGSPAAGGAWNAYGMGLVVRGAGEGRPLLGHSGGYPGFGAHLEWDTASGIGAIVLENATYAGPSVPMRAAFDRVFGETTVDSEPAPPSVPWEATAGATAALRAAIPEGGFGDPALYDPCVSLDRPFDERSAELGELLDGIGAVDRIGEASSVTPARAAFRVFGEHGELVVDLSMSPRAEPRIQSLRIRSSPPRVKPAPVP